MAPQSLNSAQQAAMNKALLTAIDARDFEMMTDAMDGGANPALLLFGGIREGHPDWVKAAVEHGADVNGSLQGVQYGSLMQPHIPYPAFFWLARYFDPAIGDYLLSKGAAIDATNANGDSALLMAVRMRNDAVVKYLAEHGADPLMICRDGRFPLAELEGDDEWRDQGKKLGVMKSMLEGVKRRAKGAGPSTAPAAAPGNGAATKEAIAVGKPLEFKKKPPAGFAL